MKKFTFKGVLDGFRSSVNQGTGPGGAGSSGSKGSQDYLTLDVVETLRSDNFSVKKVKNWYFTLVQAS